MRPTRTRLVLLACAVTSGVLAPTPALSPAGQAAPAGSGRPGGPDPLLLVENAGQVDPAVRFQARSDGMTLWVTRRSVWVSVLEPPVHPAGRSAPGLEFPRDAHDSPVRGVNLELTFPGLPAEASPAGVDPRPTRMNYLLGSDRTRWRSGIRTYGAVRWALDGGTSLNLTGWEGHPALVVQGARAPGTLRVRVRGARGLRALPDGWVVAETAVGAVPLPPVISGGRWMRGEAHGTEGWFAGTASVTGAAPEPIPPPEAPAVGQGLRYSTFLGGTDTDFTDDLAVGPDGSTYVSGWTYSPEFPTTPGAYDTTFNGASDVYVARISPTGSSLVYSTFLGGTSAETADSLALSPDGSAYVAGATASADFPTTPAAFDTTYSGGDGFITRLNPQGSDLLYSTFLGGTGGDAIDALSLSSDGTVYATGQTNSADFPTTPGAYDETFNGGSYDAFLTHLNAAGSALLYSTFLGGRYGDYGFAVAVGPGGRAYVTGEAQSFDFPTTPGAFDETFNGGNNDLFVTAFTPDGASLAFSTYLGGSGNDTGTGLAVGPAGEVHVVGRTNSPDYPTTPGAYDTTINSVNFSDALATTLNPTGSALVYSTFLGGEKSDLAHDLALEPDGSVALTGTTYSSNFPTTPGAFDRTLGGQSDAFVARFDPTGSSLLYGTFLGGTGSRHLDQGLAIALAGPGAVTVSGETDSLDFPVTPGAYDPTYNGAADGFVSTLQVARIMHVDRIVPAYRPHGSGYQVGAGIRIAYQEGSPAPGASVLARVDLPDGTHFQVSRTTGAQGIAAVWGPAPGPGTYTFTVVGVSQPGSVYDPSQNNETTDSITIP